MSGTLQYQRFVRHVRRVPPGPT
eukprot:COSAG03_NODE_27241_length_254_cov_0.754839_1_plen_22_part_01